jgi:hypothetical protein
MILEDFVMLGKTIPEPNSDGRIFVCSAGCSAELRSLVRLYPLSRWQAPRRWTVNRVPVERKPTDSRRESFCLKGNRSPETHARINGLFEGVGSIARPQRAECLRPYMVKSIREANERRMSLAIVAPLGVPVLHFDEAANAPDSPQRALFAADDNERQPADMTSSYATGAATSSCANMATIGGMSCSLRRIWIRTRCCLSEI